jgi:hypothetical protein
LSFFNFEVLQLKKVKINPIINRYEVLLVFICYDLLFFKMTLVRLCFGYK